MYKKYLVNNHPIYWKFILKKYKNKLTRLIRLAEKNYFSNKLLQVKDNMAKIWNIINNMTNRLNYKKGIDEIEVSNVKLKNSFAIAEEFNRFFVNIGPELAKQIPPSDMNAAEFLQGNHCNSMFFSPTTAEEISDVINNLKNSSSAGHDNIPVKVIKSCNILNSHLPGTYQ